MPDSKPFQKKLLPHGKPILCLFRSIPKEGKPKVFEGKETARINLKFWVADNKYPELNGYPVFYNCNPWINGGDDGRETFLYRLLCEMGGEDAANSFLKTDARSLSEDDWKGFYGYYVLKMKAPDLNEDGSLRWQDIDEVLNPEGIEFPVDSRKLERTPTPAGPIGLPKAKTPPTVPEPPANVPTPAGPEPKGAPYTPPKAPQKPIAEVLAEIQALYQPDTPLQEVLDDFRLAKGKAKTKVKNWPESEIRLLHMVMRIAEHMRNGQQYETEVTANLQKWRQTLNDLSPAGAELLLTRLDGMAAEAANADVSPF